MSDNHFAKYGRTDQPSPDGNHFEQYGSTANNTDSGGETQPAVKIEGDADWLAAVEAGAKAFEGSLPASTGTNANDLGAEVSQKLNIRPSMQSTLSTGNEYAGITEDDVVYGGREVGLGVLNGLARLKGSTADLTAYGVGAVGDYTGVLSSGDADAYRNSDLATKDAHYFGETGAAGDMASSITQFLAGYATGGQALKALGWGAKTLPMIRAATAGAMSDFVSFGAQEQRLSNAFSGTILENPVSDFLATDEDDDQLVSRLKNTIEGAGLGILTDSLVRGLRGFKRGQRLHRAGDEEGALGQMVEAADDLSESLKAVEESAVKVTKSGPAGIANVKLKPGVGSDTSPNVTLSTEQRSELASRITKAIESGDDAADLEGFDFNFSKMVNSDQSNQVINDLSAIIPDEMSNLKGGTQSLRHIEDTASLLGEKPAAVMADLQRLAKEQSDITKKFVAGKMLMVSLSREIGEKARLVMGGGTAENRQQLASLMDVMADLQSNVKAIQTGSARTTSAGRITIDDAFDGLAARIALDPDNPKHVTDSLRGGSLSRRLLEAHNEYWMSSILSGPRTHGINVLSPALMTVVRPAQQMMGGFVQGALKGDFKQVADGMNTFLYLRSGFVDSMRFMGKALKADRNILDPQHHTVDAPMRSISAKMFGLPSRKQGQSLMGELKQGDILKALKTGSGDTVDGLGDIVGVSFRALGGVDEFFKQINYRARLSATSYREGLDKGLKGDELSAHVDRRVAEGFDKTGKGIDTDARKYAQDVTLTEPLERGSIGKWVQDGVSRFPFFRNIVPFVRTPTQILRETFRNAPAGLNMIRKDMRADMFSGDPRRQALALGRIATGNLMAGSAVFLAMEGKITGGGPVNPDERKAKEATGWRPYSWVSEADDGTKTYYSFDRMEPYASIFGIAGDIAEIAGSADEAEWSEIALGITVALARNVTNKTYMTGVADAINAIGRPKQYMENWWKRRAGSYVPNFFNQTNPDPYLREVRTMVDALKAKTPGFSRDLPPRRNIFGEPLPYDAAVGPDFISPFAYSKSLNDSVREELASLEAGFGHPAQEQGNVDFTEFTNSKGQDAYDRWLELHGTVKVGGRTMQENLERVIEGNRYQRYRSDTDEGLDAKTSEIRRWIGRHRKMAERHVREEYPELDAAMKKDQRDRRLNVLTDLAPE